LNTPKQPPLDAKKLKISSETERKQLKWGRGAEAQNTPKIAKSARIMQIYRNNMQKYTAHKEKKNEKYAQRCSQTHLTSQKPHQFRKFSTPTPLRHYFKGQSHQSTPSQVSISPHISY